MQIPLSYMAEQHLSIFFCSLAKRGDSDAICWEQNDGPTDSLLRPDSRREQLGKTDILLLTNCEDL